MKKVFSLVAIIVALFCLATMITLNVSAAGTDFSTAVDISVNTQYIGNITNEYQKDFYKFTLTSSGSIHINFKHENLFDTSEYWYAVLYDSNTNEITNFGFNGTDVDIDSKEIGIDKGTYYLRITGGDYYNYGGYSRRFNTSNYNFTVIYSASAYWEKENNEDYKTATEIPVNNVIGGSINDERDYDYYKINLDSPGNIYINFKHENLSDSAEFWYAMLYDINTNVIAEYSFNGTDTSIDSKKIGLDKGTYYLRILGGDFYHYGGYSRRYKTCNYNFTIKYSESAYWEKENNEDFNSATVIPVNNVISGSINDERDYDYYKINLDSPGNISINFKHEKISDSAEYWYATLFDANTKEIASYSFMGTDTIINSKKVGLDKGTYYLRILGGDFYHYGGYSRRYNTYDYNFAVTYSTSAYWEKENNDGFETATQIADYKTFCGSINDEYDKDFYKITFSSNQYVKFTFNFSKIKEESDLYYVVVYNDATEEVSNWSVAGNLGTQALYLNLSKGTYYIRIVGGDFYNYGGYSRKYTTSDYSFKIAPYVFMKSLSTAEKTATLKWNKVSDVAGYEVLKYDTKKKTYVKVGTTSKTSYKVKNLKSGTTYKFKVRAYIVVNGVKYYSDLSPEYTATTKPSKVTIKTVKSAKSKTATVSWNKVSGASGYTVVYSTSKKFKKAKTVTVKKGKTVKATIKKLSKGKKYYFKVRAYKTVNGKKIYGAYSSVKSVKVK